MITGGIVQLKQGKIVPAAKWYGKISTFELYVAMGLLLIIPNMSDIWVNTIIVITISLVIFALIMYAIYFFKLIKKGKTDDLQ